MKISLHFDVSIFEILPTGRELIWCNSPIYQNKPCISVLSCCQGMHSFCYLPPSQPKPNNPEWYHRILI